MDPAARTSRPLTSEDLERQDRWLRSLVRGLVAESDVDDVVQQTWVAAVGGGRAGLGSKAWLGTVARRFAFRVHRGRKRRIERERLAAKEEGLRDSAEAWELLELQGNVLDAVKRLPEPYATSVLLRYMHGFSFAQVAESVGASEPAVRQRVKRGLDQLRADLSSRYQDDWRDLPALAPWLGLGSYSMKKSTAFIAGVLVLGGAAITAALVLRPGEEPRQAGARAITRPDGAERPEAGLNRLEADQGERTALSSEAVPPAASPPATVVRGIALAPDGQPLADLDLGALDKNLVQVPVEGLPRPGMQWTTDASGEFSFESRTAIQRIVPVDGRVPLAYDSFVEGGQAGRLILAPAIEVVAWITGDAGEPLGGVQVTLDGIGLKDLAQDPSGLRRVAWGPWTSDSEGRAILPDLPAGEGTLGFTLDGYADVEIQVPAASDAGLEVELSRDPVRFHLRGWLQSPAGAPVSGARVGLGERTTASAEDGSFEFRILASEPSPRHDELWAAHAPWRTTVDGGVGRRLVAAEGGSLEVQLAFEGEPLSIQGRILRPDGEPYAGLEVYPWFQQLVTGDKSAEELGADDSAPTLGLGRGLRVWAKTGAQGEFELKGLQDKEYALHLVDPERQLSGKTGQVRAGTRDWVFTVPETFEIEEWKGRVVDRRGKGVAGVRLSPTFLVYTSDRGSSWVGLEKFFLSDEDGRFTLAGVPGALLQLQLSGEGVLLARHSVKAEELGEELILTVDREMQFQLELSGERLGATGFRILDGSGEPLFVTAIVDGALRSAKYQTIGGGKTPVLTVADTAATLVIYRRPDEEIDRLPMQPTGEGVQRIAW